MILSKPYITEAEKLLVADALANSDIGIGKYIEKFEGSWAELNERKYGISCNSGTNAIFLALKALGIGPGDEVIVPEFTMAATAFAVSYTGATPIFVDCRDDLTIDPELIESRISPKTKAIIPVAIYGRGYDPKVNQIAINANLKVIEDLAEGHGIWPRGDITCYSFYGNKIITTGEGGMCLTNDEKLAEEIRLLANMYFDKGRTLIHPKIGYNFRLTNLQAAIGCGQVHNFRKILSERKQIEEWYNTYLDPKFHMPPREVVWFYDINLGTESIEELDRIKKKLEGQGILTRYFFKPMSQQPMYLAEYKHLNAYKWSLKGLYLPTYIGLKEEEIKEVCEVINSLSF